MVELAYWDLRSAVLGRETNWGGIIIKREKIVRLSDRFNELMLGLYP